MLRDPDAGQPGGPCWEEACMRQGLEDTVRGMASLLLLDPVQKQEQLAGRGGGGE